MTDFVDGQTYNISQADLIAAESDQQKLRR